MADAWLLGVDVGTGGVRAVAVTPAGEVVASAVEPLPASLSPVPGWVEQQPRDWWRAMAEALRALGDAVTRAGRRRADVRAVCVDSTSGTVLPVDDRGEPRRPALMYNDARAGAEADELNAAGADLTRRMGYRFNSSYALAKMLWLMRHEPPACAGARFLNAADFLAGRLSGEYGVTEYTNALKMGYDLLELRWPEWLAGFGFLPESLPRVVRTGEVAGRVTDRAAQETGLPAGTPVVIGPTDGVAAFYASGVTAPGEAATTLGTTLVIKALSRRIVLDPKGRLYCHRHAEGHWLPGGASNVGCEYAGKFFPQADLEALGRAARRFLPCPALLYPLARTGERFPLVQPTAARFLTADLSCEAEHFAAYLQAVAFVERWAYELIAQLGGRCEGGVFSSGGGSRSDVWMQVRADVLGRPIACTAAPDSAFGSAVLAASATLFGSLTEATRAMVRRDRCFEPDPARRARYDALYGEFRAACRARGMGE